MAGATFNKLSGQNDSLYGKILEPLRQIIIDNVAIDKEDNKLLSTIMCVETSDNWAEASTGQTGLSNMKPVEEGGKTENDMIMETYKNSVEHTTFKNRIVITAEMIEDAKGGSAVRKAAPIARQLAESYLSTRVEKATLAITSGADTTYSFEGKTFSRTTGDGQAIFSKTHKCKKTGTTNNSNIYSNAFGADSSMLNRLANIGRNLKNDTGKPTRYIFDTIMIPGNAPALEDTIKKVIASERVVGSAYNDINTQLGLWKLVVNPYWQADGTNKNPFIIMSSKAMKANMGNTFYDRTKLQIKETVDDEWNVIMSARARFSCVFYDWRHMIMGGHASGTTLS